MRTISTLSIDLCRHETPQRICVMQADANTRCVAIRLLADGAVWPIPEGITAAMGYCKPDGTGGLYDKLPDGSAAMSIEGNCLTMTLAPQVLTAQGLVRAVVTLTDADWNQLSTFPFEILVQRNPAAENIVSENYCYYTTLDAINKAIGDVFGLNIGTDLVSAINALVDNQHMEQYYPKTET